MKQITYNLEVLEVVWLKHAHALLILFCSISTVAVGKLRTYLTLG